MEADFSIVALSDDRVPDVVGLCRVALDLSDDAAEAAEIVARLRDDAPPSGATRRRHTVGLVALVGDAVVGVALGSLASQDPTVGHVDLFAVHPRQRGRGLGRALLTAVEAALATAGATQVRLAGNPPYYAWPGIDVRYTPAICTALALGYRQDGTAWNMTVDLTDRSSPALRPTAAAEERLAARGVTVRRAGPADVAAVVAFARQTFGGSWDAEVAHSIGRTGAGCHVAVGTPADGGEPKLLGFAAYGSSRPSWFGPMGTAPTAQGLGIGGVLLRRCLRDQYEAGHRRVQIGWVGPVPFYARGAGARIERVFLQYRKQL
jgi:predicted N-acetyltransferase YhbS